MGTRTGNPRGRPPGAKNSHTREREQRIAAAAEAVAAALPAAFEGDSHALLMMVYKNVENDIALRIDAAKAAIRYEKPALSSIEANVKGTIDVRAKLLDME